MNKIQKAQLLLDSVAEPLKQLNHFKQVNIEVRKIKKTFSGESCECRMNLDFSSGSKITVKLEGDPVDMLNYIINANTNKIRRLQREIRSIIN